MKFRGHAQRWPLARRSHKGLLVVFEVSPSKTRTCRDQEWCKFDLEWALFKERWQLDPKPMQDSKLVPQTCSEHNFAVSMLLSFVEPARLVVSGGTLMVCPSCTCPCTTRSNLPALQLLLCPSLSMSFACEEVTDWLLSWFARCHSFKPPKCPTPGKKANLRI